VARRQKIPDKIRKQIEIAADHCCSYCRSPLLAGVAMVVEHIVPLASGGTNELSNLCLSCYRCNQFKGTKITATDPYSSKDVVLFNPNRQKWADHFTWSKNGLEIIGLSESARATIDLLSVNSEC